MNKISVKVMIWWERKCVFGRDLFVCTIITSKRKRFWLRVDGRSLATYFVKLIIILSYIRQKVVSDLVVIVVTQSAADANGPGFNSSAVRAHLRFNSRASTLAGKQCLTMRCTVATNCGRIMCS